MRALLTDNSIGAITMFAEDLARSKAFYQEIFGLPVLFEVCAELARRGMTLLNGPMNRPWGLRTASFTDPGGHNLGDRPEAVTSGRLTGGGRSHASG